MPSTSKKQEDFMRAAAHSPDFARKAGIKQSVAKEFEAADEKKPSDDNRIKSRHKRMYKGNY